MASNSRHTENLRQALQKQSQFRQKVGRFRAGNLAMTSAVRDAQQGSGADPAPSARRKALAARRLRGY